MGIKVSTEAIFVGVKTGLKKSSTDGEQWIALSFKATEIYKGATINASEMTSANMMIFPPDNFDRTALVPGAKYALSLSVSSSPKSSSPQFDILAFKQI